MEEKPFAETSGGNGILSLLKRLLTGIHRFCNFISSIIILVVYSRIVFLKIAQSLFFLVLSSYEQGLNGVDMVMKKKQEEANRDVLDALLLILFL